MVLTMKMGSLSTSPKEVRALATSQMESSKDDEIISIGEGLGGEGGISYRGKEA